MGKISKLKKGKAKFDTDLLPEKPSYIRTVDERTIVHLARPVIEFIHDEKPDAVIAADRGGRLLALGAHYSWSKRYPGETFPTKDGKLHFARLSKNSLSSSEFGRVLRHTLIKAGVVAGNPDAEYWEDDAVKVTDDSTRVMLIDDWIAQGTTFGRFKGCLTEAGVKAENVLLATMWGAEYLRRDGVKTVCGLDHSSDTPWDANEEVMGLHYWDSSTKPTVARTTYSKQARKILHDTVDEYYSDYLQSGGIQTKSLALSAKR